jgi:CRISPR/Cas system-associated exonuclease Cas4 (RecB family)
LIAALINAGAGRHFRNADPLAIDFPNGRVLVKPNELAELPNGTIMLRRVATGKKRKDEHDRLEYTLYQLAGEEHFPNGFMVEALHLTDESIETVIITSQKLKNRRATSDEMLRGIAAGLFPVEIDPVTCPRCPHFFVCAAVPPGPLTVAAK